MAGDPFFREVWRKFQLLVHPDLFTRFPELQAANAASLQVLQGVLNDAKSGHRTTGEALRPRTEQLTFYIRASRILPRGGGATRAAGGAAAPQRGGSGSGSGSASTDDASFVRVPLTLRIPGPNCQHVLAESLGELFGHCRLPTRFHWGAEYWGSTYVAPPDDKDE